ncbi:MAG: CPBP family intramembrane metalloprotease [Acidobacteria bacterium]|nr:CPBP family intramembrane metalloprotease [Acidobacteriota bacterium]
MILCSDYPTQIVLSDLFGRLGYAPANAAGALNIGFVVVLSLVDSVILVGLVIAFLRAHGERPAAIFLGPRTIAGEARRGIVFIFVAIFMAAAVLLALQAVAPWLHTVPENPLRDLISSPRNAWLFALVVIVAGGIREEIQRAFLLHRFEVWLGGPVVGVVVTSAAFGAGHLVQGADAAVATAVLGAFWGIVYLRRRSVVAPMVSHAGFDLLQIAQFLSAP